MKVSEWLCLWYLRLNGYLGTPAYVLHGTNGALTDVDVLAVRFSGSKELDFNDHAALRFPTERIDVLLAEAKRGIVEKLNGPWVDSTKGTFEYVLSRIGLFKESQISEIAKAIYENRRWCLGDTSVRVACFAESKAATFNEPHVIFVSWDEILRFIHDRFAENDKLKADHYQWDRFGHELWKQLVGPLPATHDFFASLEKLGPW